MKSDYGAASAQALVSPAPVVAPLREARRSTLDAAGLLPLPPDVAFLVHHGHDFGALYRASARAASLGVPASDALIAAGELSEHAYLETLGSRLGLPVVASVAALDGRTTLEAALRQGWCRATLDDGRQALLVSRRGALMRLVLEAAPGLRAAPVALATQADFRAILTSAFSARIALDAASSVPAELSARTGGTLRQRAFGLAALAAFVLAGLWNPEALRLLAPLAFGIFFLGASLVMLSACIEGAPVFARDIETDDARLPTYSVLVPLYREAAILDGLILALDALDYPPEKLQILLVVEEHDSETREALAARSLPAHIGVFVAPPGAPHTKPRAINAAMPFATGDFVVVYDAEDRPEPDQLRAAAAAFAIAPREVACLQARLAIDNTDDGWLTRMFTIEYAALFDVVKAGNARLGLPVPLGGTSNHFRAETLRRIGLWDAWNVTEDADLGIRLALHGLLVDDLPSTTDEEAPNRFTPWLHQRTRWLKGWMQTVIVHGRAPIVSARRMGFVNFISAVAMSAGVVIGALGAPFFYLLLALRLGSGAPLGAGGGLSTVADGVLIVLGIAGLSAMLLPALIGLARRRLLRLSPWILTLPAYHLLTSLAAWIAVLELIRAPHRWNKTMHGAARTSRLLSQKQ